MNRIDRDDAQPDGLLARYEQAVRDLLVLQLRADIGQERIGELEQEVERLKAQLARATDPGLN